MMRYERTSPVKHPGRIAVIVVLLVVVLGMLLLQKGVFVLHKVWVEGTTRYSSEQIVELAGLKQGQSILTLDQKAITQNVQRDRYLMLDSMYIDYPDGLVLRVRERLPKAVLAWLGRVVLLDELNSVMDISTTLDEKLHVPVVTGMDIVSADVGLPLVTKDVSRMQAMSAIMKELDLQVVTARVSELNVAHLDNLYLVTTDGFRVILGDESKLEQKIGLMRAAVASLEESGASPGTLDVSEVTTADYQEAKDYERVYQPEATAVPNELVGI